MNITDYEIEEIFRMTHKEIIECWVNDLDKKQYIELIIYMLNEREKEDYKKQCKIHRRFSANENAKVIYTTYTSLKNVLEDYEESCEEKFINTDFTPYIEDVIENMQRQGILSQNIMVES